MKKVFGAALSALVLSTAVSAQGPAPAALQVPNPKYVAIPMEITVNKPVADVWKRVGKYCDIAEWLNLACTMQSGQDGEVGAVRSLAGGRILEILVAKTEYSYTYTQPVREGQKYDMYHGTIEARALTPTTTKLLYTLMVDESQLADDAAVQQDVQRRRTSFERALANMKILAEGGTLPPPPARGGGAGGGRGN